MNKRAPLKVLKSRVLPRYARIWVKTSYSTQRFSDQRRTAPCGSRARWRPNTPSPHTHPSPAFTESLSTGIILGSGETGLIFSMNKQTHKCQGWCGKAPPDPSRRNPSERNPGGKFLWKHFFFFFKRSLFGYILFQVLKCLNSHTIKVTASYVRFYVF